MNDTNTNTNTNIELPYTDAELVNSIRSISKSGFRNITLRPSRYYGGTPFLVATVAHGKTDKLYLGSAPADQGYSLALLVGLIQAARHHGGDPSVLVGRDNTFGRKDLKERIKLARQFLADTLAMSGQEKHLNLQRNGYQIEGIRDGLDQGEAQDAPRDSEPNGKAQTKAQPKAQPKTPAVSPYRPALVRVDPFGRISLDDVRGLAIAIKGPSNKHLKVDRFLSKPNTKKLVSAVETAGSMFVIDPAIKTVVTEDGTELPLVATKKEAWAVPEIALSYALDLHQDVFQALSGVLNPRYAVTPMTQAPARSGRNERSLKFVGFQTPSNPVPNGIKRSKAALSAYQNALNALLKRAEEVQAGQEREEGEARESGLETPWPVIVI